MYPRGASRAERRRRDPTRAYHDRVAGIYDGIYEGDPYWRLWRDLVWRRARRALPPPPAPVLDAGGGTGHFGLRLARAGWRVTISDLSPKMCEVARAKAAELPPSRRPEVAVADVQDLAPFADRSFEAALAIGDVISFCADPLGALRSLRRVLRPGGVLVATVDGAYGQATHFLRAGDVPALERFLRDGRTEFLAKREEERFPTRAFTPEALRALLGEAGFAVETLAAQPALPLREHREVLADTKAAQRLLAIELRIGAREALLGGAAHLLCIARAHGSP
ncbi:MAG: class I SAM-dependent methyltransferase [Planctomycetales bacterium]|nr:class I SAM-dependent methyltransferase [Planctomycetales bacterium]